MNRQEREDEITRRTDELYEHVTHYLEVFDLADVLTGPSRYFHEETLSRRKQFGTPGEAVHDTFFLQLLYATLTAWGLHKGGASKTKLVEFEKFATSLHHYAKDLDDLQSLHIKDMPAGDESSRIIGRLWGFIQQVDVSATKSEIVAGSKVLHHLLPKLVPPIDRKYTSEFFSWHNRMQGDQRKMFKDVYPRLVGIARRLAPQESEYIGRSRHKTLAKVVDNAIVGFIIDKERKAEFDQLRAQLDQLMKDYNPRGENLHFPPFVRADEKLFARLLDLSRKGVDAVKKHRRYFKKHGLYSDGMFWYDLFQMISSAALRIHADLSQRAIPVRMVRGIVNALVDISAFTVSGMDIEKRNHEALGNTLVAFPGEAMVRRARDRARKIDSDGVTEFVEWTIERVGAQRK